MRWRALLGAAGVLAAGIVFFDLAQRPLTGPLIGMATHGEVAERLQRSLDDQKRLAELLPDESEAYRREFEETLALSQRLRILEHSRDQVTTRYRRFLLTVVAASLLAAGAFFAWRSWRVEHRLRGLEVSLGRLAAGDPTIEVADRGRDVIGTIGRMIERASGTMARDRRRLATLENLGRWQEAARRQAHEIRTPLATAQLELERLRKLVTRDAEAVGEGQSETGGSEDLEARAEAISRQLERLSSFTRGFATFARLPSPRPASLDLVAYLQDFTTTFASAWPAIQLELRVDDDLKAGQRGSRFDPDMLRQVLVNLCANSAAALAGRDGTISLSVSTAPGPAPWGNRRIEVLDDGPGVPEELREHLFEPYVTSKGMGEGMGLGLAISKKILLEHGGDLSLLPSERGARFELVLPGTAIS